MCVWTCIQEHMMEQVQSVKCGFSEHVDLFKLHTVAFLRI